MSKDLVRKMRHNMTGPERKIWRVLQELKPLGYHFQRRVPVGQYYADFACHHANLIIEVGEERHADDLARAYDAIRDEFLHGEGFDVMRLSNDDVVHNWGGVLMAIEQVLADRPKSPAHEASPTPNLSPQGGEKSGTTSDGSGTKP